MKFLRIKSGQMPVHPSARSPNVGRIPDASPISPGSARYDHEVSTSDSDDSGLLDFHPAGDAIAARKKKQAEEAAIKKVKAEANRKVLDHKANRKFIYSLHHFS